MIKEALEAYEKFDEHEYLKKRLLLLERFERLMGRELSQSESAEIILGHHAIVEEDFAIMPGNDDYWHVAKRCPVCKHWYYTPLEARTLVELGKAFRALEKTLCPLCSKGGRE